MGGSSRAKSMIATKLDNPEHADPPEQKWHKRFQNQFYYNKGTYNLINKRHQLLNASMNLFTIQKNQVDKSIETTWHK